MALEQAGREDSSEDTGPQQETREAGRQAGRRQRGQPGWDRNGRWQEEA